MYIIGVSQKGITESHVRNTDTTLSNNATPSSLGVIKSIGCVPLRKGILLTYGTNYTFNMNNAQ